VSSSKVGEDLMRLVAIRSMDSGTSAVERIIDDKVEGLPVGDLLALMK